MQCRTSPNSLALAFVALASPAMVATAAQAEEQRTGEVLEVPVADNALVIQDTLITAEREARQALGSSIITADDIKRHPPSNDLSDIIRREPGVNLTGNRRQRRTGQQPPDRPARHGPGKHPDPHRWQALQRPQRGALWLER